MSRLLKSFPELSLKLLALGTIADTNVALQFPAPGPQAPFPGTAIPLKYLTDGLGGPLAEAGGWHHGGINE
jgi:hypothetical protein